MDLIKITPNKEKVKSILKMISLIEERIAKQDKIKFVSLVIADYYEIIKELMTAILLMDGYKTLSHKDLTDYIKEKYREFNTHEITIINDLRVLRNRITYEGFFIEFSYLSRNENFYILIIQKLKAVVEKKLK